MTEVTGLEAELRSNGISVEAIDAGATVSLSYLTAFPGESVNHREMGRACNTFIDLADEGEWEPVPVEATVLRADDDVLGTWRIDPEWIRGLNAYELSETDFSERVLGTLEED
jgi:hypothetical protein